jgi:hypothetical protein
MTHPYDFPKITRSLFTPVAGLLALGLLLGSPAVRAQAPTWQSAIVVGTNSSYSEVKTTVVDAAGNVYVAGAFGGTVQIGSTTLTSAGQDEIFVAKWSATSRSFVWAVRAGGTDIDLVGGLAVSGSNVYLAGSFNSLSASFGGITLANANTSANQRAADLFVAKLTDAGTSASFAWAVRAGGPATEAAQTLVVVGSSLYVGGLYYGAFSLGSAALTSAGSSDFFVAKLTDAGGTATVDWAVGGGSSGADEVTAVAVNGGSVYAAGNFENTVMLGNQLVTSAGASDLFVTKLTDAGSSASYVWARAAGGPSGEYLRGLALTGSSVYVAGEFSSVTASFGSTTLTNASTNTDGYVAKLTDAGPSASFTWAQRLGGTGYEALTALAVRGGSVYVAGHFNGATTSLGSTTLPNSGAAGTYDLYVGRLLDAGSSSNFVWGQQAGSPASDYLRVLTSAGTALYAAGSADLPATFGSQTLTGPAGSRSSFFATVSDATGLPARAATEVLPGFALSPNPAHDLATVLVPVATGPATLTLFDAMGRLARTTVTLTGVVYQFNLTGLAPGMYALRVQAGEVSAVQRLVVE